jgi:hypothetical protein
MILYDSIVLPIFRIVPVHWIFCFTICEVLFNVVKLINSWTESFGCLILQVILDVVYSHTAEDGDEAPKTISFRGIDNANYYILDKFGTYVHKLAPPLVHISLLIIPGSLLNCCFSDKMIKRKHRCLFTLAYSSASVYMHTKERSVCFFHSQGYLLFDEAESWNRTLELPTHSTAIIQLSKNW